MSLVQVQIKLVSPEDVVTAHGTLHKGKTGGFKGQDVLDALRRVNKLVKNDEGEEVYRTQFDSQHFEFKVGEGEFVPENVAWGLRNDSGVFIDGKDPLGSPFVRSIIEVDRWTPGMSKPAKQVVKPALAVSRTKCPECEFDEKSLTKLAEHLLDVHTEATVA
jgi:hypothetical protein